MSKFRISKVSAREAIQAAIDSVGLIPKEKLRVMRIKNTMELEQIDISSAYLESLQENPDLEIVSKQKAMTFDANGNLETF